MKLSFSHHMSDSGCLPCSSPIGPPLPPLQDSSVIKVWISQGLLQVLHVQGSRGGVFVKRVCFTSFLSAPVPSFSFYYGYALLMWGTLEGHFLPAFQTGCLAPVPSSLVFPHLSGACHHDPLGIWTRGRSMRPPYRDTHHSLPFSLSTLPSLQLPPTSVLSPLSVSENHFCNQTLHFII